MCEKTSDTSTPESLPTMDEVAWYRIQIVGKLDPSWSDRLGGMKINVSGQVGKETITTLNGQVLDQCALAGVLTVLHDLHLPILTLEYLANNNGKVEGE